MTLKAGLVMSRLYVLHGLNCNYNQNINQKVTYTLSMQIMKHCSSVCYKRPGISPFSENKTKKNMRGFKKISIYIIE